MHVNATDLPSGSSFRFSQDSFDVICSDLNQFRVSWAVAASSAVPGLLSPVTLKNHAGTCGFERPDWWDESLKSRATNPRGWRADQKKFIHLVDGGISDNLGVRAPLDRIAAIGDIEKARELSGLGMPDHIVVIVVNAETEPDPTIDLKSAAPGLAASLNPLVPPSCTAYCRPSYIETPANSPCLLRT